MTNYYTLFKKFVKEKNMEDGVSMEHFINEFKIYFGLGGRNNSVKKWIKNFVDVNFIKIEKVKGSNDSWKVYFLDGCKK